MYGKDDMLQYFVVQGNLEISILIDICDNHYLVLLQPSKLGNWNSNHH